MPLILFATVVHLTFLKKCNTNACNLHKIVV
nr:MAG TPA: hypothetical protein [Caudoviricetes sp.]